MCSAATTSAAKEFVALIFWFQLGWFRSFGMDQAKMNTKPSERNKYMDYN